MKASHGRRTSPTPTQRNCAVICRDMYMYIGNNGRSLELQACILLWTVAFLLVFCRFVGASAFPWFAFCLVIGLGCGCVTDFLIWLFYLRCHKGQKHNPQCSGLVAQIPQNPMESQRIPLNTNVPFTNALAWFGRRRTGRSGPGVWVSIQNSNNNNENNHNKFHHYKLK